MWTKTNFLSFWFFIFVFVRCYSPKFMRKISNLVIESLCHYSKSIKRIDLREILTCFSNNSTVKDLVFSDKSKDLDEILGELTVEVPKEELHPAPRKRKVHTKLHSMTLCFLRYQSLMSLRSGNPPRRKRYDWMKLKHFIMLRLKPSRSPYPTPTQMWDLSYPNPSVRLQSRSEKHPNQNLPHQSQKFHQSQILLHLNRSWYHQSQRFI